jgi:hypothetical protein
MAGSTGSGQTVESGRTNRAEGRTTFWGQVPPGQPNFNGPAVVIAEIARSAVDPDDYEDGDSFTPSNLVHGVIAFGWSGGGPAAFGGTPLAVGVIGRGGNNQGTGVVGEAGGAATPDIEHRGEGGIGVHGIGGTRVGKFPGENSSPGAGVVGQGGRQPRDENRLRLPHAAGVIGLGGSKGYDADTLAAIPPGEPIGAGVYGKGADAQLAMVVPLDADGNSTSGPLVPSGPLGPGPGVLGRGGVQEDGSGASAAGVGVVGLSANAQLPSYSETVGSGVFGRGDVGVLGDGEIGLYGRSGGGNGLLVETRKRPQAQFIPLRISSPAQLTSKCFAGEFLVTLAIDERGTEIASLWFCTVGGPPGLGNWVKLA